MFYPVLYAETHYHLKYLYPLYYKREPEIIFDLPIRVLVKKTDYKIPVFLLVKNADKFPVYINNIKINLFFKKTKKTILLKEKIYTDSKQEYFTFYISVENCWIEQFLSLNINFTVNGKNYVNDNYYGSAPHNFKTFISDRISLFPEKWFIGDTHYHSIYTSDQVEFGAPLEMTKKIAIAMGLNWFFVTDHSYDLDDNEDDYLLNDPFLKKWEKMKNECKQLSDSDFKIQFGEELSVGNSLNQNIHALVIGHQAFLNGSGDSAENWLKNQPENTLENLDKSNIPLIIAAHPFEKVPFLQKVLLNRGSWDISDYLKNDITYLQIINGQSYFSNIELIDKYIDLLLCGYKFFILAGNDAHGNFQFMKQIKIPFVKFLCRKQQLFGNFFTAFYYEENLPLEGLKNNQIIVSNGPFLSFSINYSGTLYHIGDTIFHDNQANPFIINFNYETSIEFGRVKKIELIIGDSLTKKVKRIINPENIVSVHLKNDSFCLCYLVTEKYYIALTNPLWIKIV